MVIHIPYFLSYFQLLLHHVIPGQFEIESLQDEMTGVSLAGTQLRVNQYNMHDAEWNDVKVRSNSTLSFCQQTNCLSSGVCAYGGASIHAIAELR